MVYFMQSTMYAIIIHNPHSSTSIKYQPHSKQWTFIPFSHGCIIANVRSLQSQFILLPPQFQFRRLCNQSIRHNNCVHYTSFFFLLFFASANIFVSTANITHVIHSSSPHNIHWWSSAVPFLHPLHSFIFSPPYIGRVVLPRVVLCGHSIQGSPLKPSCSGGPLPNHGICRMLLLSLLCLLSAYLPPASPPI